jgi:hypothetical protein
MDNNFDPSLGAVFALRGTNGADATPGHSSEVTVIFDFDHTLATTDVSRRHLAAGIDVATTAFGGAPSHAP